MQKHGMQKPKCPCNQTHSWNIKGLHEGQNLSPSDQFIYQHIDQPECIVRAVTLQHPCKIH